MEKHIYDEKNGLHYTLGEDGLYYPDITIDEQEHHLIGKYGRMREHFLKEHRAGTYTRLLLTGSILICLKLTRWCISVWMKMW